MLQQELLTIGLRMDELGTENVELAQANDRLTSERQALYERVESLEKEKRESGK